jgi:hypothetical protein
MIKVTMGLRNVNVNVINCSNYVTDPLFQLSSVLGTQCESNNLENVRKDALVAIDGRQCGKYAPHFSVRLPYIPTHAFSCGLFEVMGLGYVLLRGKLKPPLMQWIAFIGIIRCAYSDGSHS